VLPRQRSPDCPPEPSPPPRIKRLLDRWRPTGRERTWHADGADERAVLLWRYFQRSTGEPIALRRARGLAYVLDRVRIAIHDDELIVGEVGLDDVSQTCPADLAAARAYWSRRFDGFVRKLPTYDAERSASAHGLSWKWCNRDGHAIPAFERILADGLDGLRTQVRSAASAYPPEAVDYADRQAQWQAMAIALDALAAYVLRYVALAREMAAVETQPVRREELQQIAAACEHVAGEPVRTFREALQLVWFVHLGIKMDDGGVGHSFGRFDQYLYPFLQCDLQAGRLTLVQARELLALFWIKLNREGDDLAHLTLAGQTPDGADATNGLSLLCVQVERWVSRKQPNLSTRVHAATPDWYWTEIARTVRQGAGHPAIFNDGVIIPGLVDYGLPEALARDHAQVGCVETFLPGRAAPWTDCYLNLAKCLELALNDGCCMLTGDRLGPSTGDPRTFGAFDLLFAAYEEQVRDALYQMLSAKDGYDAVVSRIAPEPLNSAVVLDCLERGRDASDGGARYLLTGAYGVGLGTTVDSLAAIKTLVYDDRLLGLDKLVAALEDGFVGHERVCALCRDRAPKYGNDEPRADEVAVRAVESFGRLMRAYPSPSPHALHYGMLGSVTSHTKMGAATAASADGRRSGETLSDGGSPSQGANRRGPTATLRSLAKPDYRLVPGGAAINLMLSPVSVSGEAGLSRLTELLKGYVAMGGEQLQINVVDGDTLRRAAADPDRYRDLVVRVAGFTAYFVTLTPELQWEIIARSDALT
jgi:pyruvate formate-lyase/glycerol dehydratase family glycyl radical enzyme